MATAAPRVCAVIVVYQPDPRLLAAAVDAACRECARVLVIDNGIEGSGDSRDAWFLDRVDMHVPGCNTGLGRAYNHGAHHAAATGCTHVLILDQDSVLSEGAVATLLSAETALSSQGRVGAVGPRIVDRRTGEVAPFVRFGFPFNHKISVVAGPPVACDFLISSGSLIRLDVLERIGPMDEALFIDSVDLEWCFRACAAGFGLWGVPEAALEHSIGDRVRTLPFGLGQVLQHSPPRLYTMTRNRVALYRRMSTPVIWIAQDVPRLIFKFLRFALLVPPRLLNARAMLRGVMAGLQGRLGPPNG
jgi:rhamnosyltransferase